MILLGTGCAFQHQVHAVTLMLCRFLNAHLVNLLDGQPHEVSLRKVLPLNLGHHDDCLVTASEIDGSRIALVIEFASVVEAENHELIVWDWRTGEMVSVSLSVAGEQFQSNLNPGAQTLER